MFTKKISKLSALVTLTLGGTILLAGCESKGPAQQAGEQIDAGVQKAKDAIDPPGPLEKAGRETDKASGK